MSEEIINEPEVTNSEQPTPTPEVKSPLFDSNDDPAFNEPAPQPKEWIPESFKDNEYLSDYSSVEDVLKEFTDLKEARANANMDDFVKLSDDPKDIQNLYSKLGKPESPDKYEYTKPEGVDERFIPKDEELKAFNELAYEANFTQDQYNKAMEYVNQLSQQGQEALDAKFTNNLEALTKEWGAPESPGFVDNQKYAQAAYNAFADEATKEYFKNNPEVATDPKVLGMLAKIGRELEVDIPNKSDSAASKSFQGTDPVKDIKDFRAKHAEALNNKNHEEHKQRHKELFALYAKKNNVPLDVI